MKFILHVNTDNEDFQPEAGIELAEILREVAKRVEHASNDDLWAFETIRDSNGNDVGRYALKPDNYE